MERNILESQKSIIGEAKVIFDIGAQHGHTTIEYLDAFPSARLYGFEADVENYERARVSTQQYGARCSISNCAVGEVDGYATFNVNSHNGTHSLLEIGAVEYFHQPAHHVRTITVPKLTLDSFCVTNDIPTVDIVKMDIQGAELLALKGAANLIDRGGITLLALEASFQPLYKNQPLFWDVCSYLYARGYSLFDLYDMTYHPNNPNALCWADAIFVSPRINNISR